MELLEKSRQNVDTVLKELETRLDGLSQSEADSRLIKYGPNELPERSASLGLFVCYNVKNPLVILLTAGRDFFSHRRLASDGGHLHDGAAGRGAAFLSADAGR